jgi:hypothetical protein
VFAAGVRVVDSDGVHSMNRPAEVIWLSHDSQTDHMGEFGAEGARPAPRAGRLIASVAATPAGAVPPPLSIQSKPVVAPTAPAAPATVAAAAVLAPAEPEPPKAPAVRSQAAQQGRWFLWVCVLALLTLAQAPFVVLWALQSVDNSVPVPVEIVREPVAFTPAPPPIEPAVAPPRPVTSVPRPVPTGALSGWVRVEVPIAMRITEDGRLLGTTDVDRLMLPVGEHVLDLRNDELGFTTRQFVDVTAGETTVVPIRLPSASISINAKPWAEAWVDGERVGETPIGTLMRPIGRHEVVLRHPELGERRVPVVVSLGQPARVSVDFKAAN